MVINYFKSGYEKLKTALFKTSSYFDNKLRSILVGDIDENTIDQLEQIFYEADLGANISSKLIEKVKDYYQNNPKATAEDYRNIIKQELIANLKQIKSETKLSTPHIILIVGVNGNGKTTSIAKLANLYQREGKKVLVAAADTFRAAAVEQLELWAQHLNIEIVKGKMGSDPAAVVYDSIQAGMARDLDYIIIDTAGRLHTKLPLMQELEKIKRTIKKLIPSAPHETLLVLDATVGQNAIDQAKTFHQYTPLTGIILTKLDGSSKGGAVFSIQQQLNTPVKYIGTGEDIDDIQVFQAENFVEALLQSTT